ncbi:MAG: helix-turn-helix domain-containing protein [Nitrososphaerota archaeon]
MPEECGERCTETCLCSLEGIITTVSKKWAFLVINTLGHYQKLRYNQIMHELHNISPKALSDILKRLEKESLVRREVFKEIPPRVEYSLTEDGRELRGAVIPLLKWASNRHNLHGEKMREPIRESDSTKSKMSNKSCVASRFDTPLPKVGVRERRPGWQQAEGNATPL